MSTMFLNQGEVSGELKRVPVRADVRVEDTWDLAPLFGSDAEWEMALAKLGEEYLKVHDFQGTVGKSAHHLLNVLEFEKSIDLQVEQLHQYAALKLTEDSSNKDSLAREARLQSLTTRMGEAFSFITPELQEIPDEFFARYLEDPLLKEWVTALKKIRRRKPHTLSKNEERLLALGAAVMEGHHDTFSQLTNVDMKFGVVRDEKGREVELTQSSFSSFLVQRDGAVREKAFRQFYTEFSEHQYTLATSLVNSVRSDVFYARARNHASAIEAALFSDDVPLNVYDNLLATVREHRAPLFRYFDIRRRALGLAELHHYDTYVPLVGDIHTHISWDEAVDKVLDAVEPLGKEYGQILGNGLREGRWCDRYENKGKRSGAFSYGTYQSPPYIMMNYKSDVFSDVYTLAHEAGHSMHSWYSKTNQTYQDSHYPIFLAEVASTFNEMLLTEHLLATNDDPKMRAYVINRQIDDLRGTLYRQTMFAEFEKRVHEVEEAGEALTLDVFQEIYRGLLNTYFEKNFVIDEELELECLRIPHFYSNFYVYKYATGISAAAALAEQVLKTGEVARYLQFLKSGGSKFPLQTLADAGVDMRSPQPIEAALRLFARRVAELEELIGR